MIDVELLGAELAPAGPALAEVRSLCAAAAQSRGVGEGHVAIEYVEAGRIAELNAAHRGKHEPTDVLSFPIDGVEPISVARLDGEAPRAQDAGDAPPPVPRELGDVVICPEHTADLGEAIFHGMLHLLGMDHETDEGEMLALQRELLARARR
jgi:probable rRNA maturation factor